MTQITTKPPQLSQKDYENLINEICRMSDKIKRWEKYEYMYWDVDVLREGDMVTMIEPDSHPHFDKIGMVVDLNYDDECKKWHAAILWSCGDVSQIKRIGSNLLKRDDIPKPGWLVKI